MESPSTAAVLRDPCRVSDLDDFDDVVDDDDDETLAAIDDVLMFKFDVNGTCDN